MPRRDASPPSASRTIKVFLRRILNGPWVSPSIGAATGFFGGGFTVAIAGALIGYLLHQVIKQIRLEKRILSYYENPGILGFYEAASGLAAFCALGSNIASQGRRPFGSARIPGDRAIVRDVANTALEAFFPGSLTSAQLENIRREIESYCYLAFRGKYLLNGDLLAESLAAKRRPYKDAPRFGKALATLAFDRETLEEVQRWRSVLDPSYRREQTADAPNPGRRAEPPTPWEILGLEPGSSREDVKAHFRKMAILLHPDKLHSYDEVYRAEAAGKFIAARNAYLELLAVMRNDS